MIAREQKGMLEGRRGNWRTPRAVKQCLAAAAGLWLGAAVGCGKGGGSQEAGRAQANGAPVSEESVQAAVDAAQQYINTADMAKAKAILLRLVARAPEESRAHELLGQVYVFEASQLGEEQARNGQRLLEQAAEEYEQAVKLAGETSAGLSQSAGMMALAAGRTERALEHFEAAGKLDPRNPQPKLFQAQILMQRNEQGKAKALLEEFLKLDADEPYALASLAVIAVEEGDGARAMALAARAREIAPDDVNIRVQEARVLRRTGNARRCVELLSGLGEEERKSLAVADELSRGMTALGEHEGARRALELAMSEVQPPGEAWRLYVRMGEARLAAGQKDEAEFWLSQAEQRRPEAKEAGALREAISKAP